MRVTSKFLILVYNDLQIPVFLQLRFCLILLNSHAPVVLASLPLGYRAFVLVLSFPLPGVLFLQRYVCLVPSLLLQSLPLSAPDSKKCSLAFSPQIAHFPCSIPLFTVLFLQTIHCYRKQRIYLSLLFYLLFSSMFPKDRNFVC